MFISSIQSNRAALMLCCTFVRRAKPSRNDAALLRAMIRSENLCKCRNVYVLGQVYDGRAGPGSGRWVGGGKG